MHKNKEGVWDGFHYPDRVCVKKFLGICTKKRQVSKVFLFSDQQAMEWFGSNDMGAKQREMP